MCCIVSLSLTASVLISSVAAAAFRINNSTLWTNQTQIAVSTALINTPINVASSQVHDYVSDANFNAAIYRDGGGGGYINGYHVISFADSFTTEAPGTVNSSVNSFVHNSFAYMGYKNSDDPTDVYDFGTENSKGERTFVSTGMVAQDNETDAGFTVAVWPNSNMVPLKGNQALAVYSVYDVNALQTLYNTMVVINVANPNDPALSSGSTLKASRVVPQLFYANENLYGSFATYKSTGLTGEPTDKYIYFFSTSDNGIKVAKVAPRSKLVRENYQYWNGNSWSSTQPQVADESANLISWSYVNYINNGTYGPGTGDVFWSTYFNTYIVAFQGDGIDSSFYISYSETQSITGPYTEPELLFSTPANAECAIYSPNWDLNYAGHAYPAWDPTGQTLLLSWSSCNAWITMATVSFA